MTTRGLKPDCGRSVIPELMENDTSLVGFRRVDVVCPFWGWSKGMSCIFGIHNRADLKILSSEKLGKHQGATVVDNREIMVDDTQEIPEVRGSFETYVPSWFSQADIPDGTIAHHGRLWAIYPRVR